MSLASVVLAAHGSTDSPRSNQPLFQLAKRVNELGNFAAVTPAFLNGEPLMNDVFCTLPPGKVIIVPVMTSQGYYLKKLPAIFAENKNIDRYDFRFTGVAGIQPAIAKTMAARIQHFVSAHRLTASETTVVIIGHGTRRNPNSGTSTCQLTDSIATKLGPARPRLTFMTAFLDQDPELEKVVAEISTPNIIAMPFLISRGPHMTGDVPGVFGLPTGPDIEFPLLKKTNSGVTLCDAPLGLYPEMADIILELANESVANSTLEHQDQIRMEPLV